VSVSIYQQWLNAKGIETAAIKTRRDLEDAMVKAFNVPENLDGTKNVEDDGYKVKIEGRINRKVNGDKLQELAAEHGLTDHLASLFRWKPEIAMTAWKAADASITTPLLDAITATPGRPSFTITKADKE
jgi:hypothetical protein